MITISEATPNDFETIQEIAHKAWWIAYGSILSKNQIDYMLDLMYNLEVLKTNFIHKNHRFLLIHEFEIAKGFASYEHHYLETNCTRLHKLYLLPESKGKGFGKLLLNEVVKIARSNHSDSISLNVNRLNPSFLFYQKMGFKIIAEENLAIGNGYFMEDYKMEKCFNRL